MSVNVNYNAEEVGEATFFRKSKIMIGVGLVLLVGAGRNYKDGHATISLLMLSMALLFFFLARRKKSFDLCNDAILIGGGIVLEQVRVPYSDVESCSIECGRVVGDFLIVKTKDGREFRLYCENNRDAVGARAIISTAINSK